MTNQDTYLLVTERISRSPLTLRGQRVLLDADLAELYGVSTKGFNEKFRRNRARFSADFAFQLTEAEAKCHCGQRRRHLPYAFTVHGAVMAAMILDSSRAVGIIRELTNLPLLLKLSPHRFHS